MAKGRGHLMDALPELDALMAAMPPAGAMRIRSVGADADTLRLHAPLAANLNDKGCAFGGSLASIMTLASWGWVVHRLAQAGQVADVFVADSQLRYLAPLYDDLAAEARLREDQDWPGILRCLAERGRARASLVACVRDAAGTPVATMEARYALIRPAAAATA
jgi:thioesterase domain-containing protein